MKGTWGPNQTVQATVHLVNPNQDGKVYEELHVDGFRTPLTGDTMQPVGPVTISIGVAVFPNHGRDIDELIDVADRAMYASKEMGRNRVTLAEGGVALIEAAA